MLRPAAAGHSVAWLAVCVPTTAVERPHQEVGVIPKYWHASLEPVRLANLEIAQGNHIPESRAKKGNNSTL